MLSIRLPERSQSTGIRSMLPQSRKITVRSARSAGASWKTSCSGRKRYSSGSGNSFSARNISESLPSCVSASWSARVEPSASPSGPSWVVIRKRSLSASSATIASVAISISDLSPFELTRPSSSSTGRHARPTRRRRIAAPASA